jgi:peptide deformylase
MSLPSPSPSEVDPAGLRIVHYPAEVLRTKAQPVACSPEVVAVADRMIQLMHDAPGIGLAAPQVGLSWRLFVVDVPDDDDRQGPGGPADAALSTDGPEIYIDPVISRPQGRFEVMEEGCLSLPGILGEVSRPPTVTMTYTDRTGQRVTRKASGLLARCWQHELDHLDGVLILDRMSKPDRLRVRTKLEKLEQAAQADANR